MEAMKNLIALIKQKRQLEDDLKAVKEKISVAEPVVLAEFQREGVDKITLHGTTLYLRREIWAGKEPGIESDVAIKALIDAGLDEYAAPKINYSSLSAYFRELDKENEPLPAALVGVLRPVEKFRLGTTNGG